MNLSDRLSSEEDVLVLLGNGLRDEKLLRALAPRLDGKQVTLAITRISPMIGRKTGLAALEGLSATLHAGYRVGRALFVVDREHVENLESIEERLRMYGFEARWIERRGDYGATLDLIRRQHRVKLFIAVAGRKKSLNEELEELANQVYKEGSDVPANLKRIKIKELISKATLREIERKLRGVFFALRRIDSGSTC